jgi:hypothetical protein
MYLLCFAMAHCCAGILVQMTPTQIQNPPSMRVREHASVSAACFNLTRIDANGAVLEPKEVVPITYLQKSDLSHEAQRELDKIHPGITRSSLKKTWQPTGGLTPDQFILPEKGGGPEFVAIRIEWRPAGMPVNVFQNRTLRLRWLKHHAPLPAPDDIAMRISRPHLAPATWD